MSRGTTARITDTGVQGDLRISFGWERVVDHQMPQATMYLSKRSLPQQMVAIPITSLWRFDYRDKDPRTGEPACLPLCRRVAEMVYGGFASQQDVHRVLDAITNFATDLKNMPPASTFRNIDHMEEYMRSKGYDVARHEDEDYELERARRRKVQQDTGLILPPGVTAH